MVRRDDDNGASPADARAALSDHPRRDGVLRLGAPAVDGHDIPGEAEALHAGYDESGDIDLPPAQAMASGPGKRMVVVVPRLPERRQR
jgi:hypothetical protein